MATAVNTPDLYEMSEEDFQKEFERAQAEAQGQQPPQDPPADSPQDPPQDTPQDPPQQQDVDEVVYRREIDLGDGSGKQVFEAPTMEELVDKLADAQVHATRKIRELAQAQRQPAQQPAGPTDEEKFVLGQELVVDPYAAFGKLVEKQLGRTPDKLRADLERLDNFERQQAAEQAAVDFVQKHPEYHAIPANGQKIERYMQRMGWERTLEHIEKAYADLEADGLLVHKSVDAPPTTEQQPATQQGRIAQPETTRTVVVQRKAASGLSARRSAPVAKPEPTEDDLYNMPMDEFLKLGGMDQGF